MKTSRMLIAVLALPLAGLAKEDKSLTLAELPQKAAAAITAAAGKEQTKIKSEKEDGVAAFEAKWTAGGRKHEITVTAEGTVLSEEEIIPLEAAPAPAQAAIKAITAGKLIAVEKVTEKGATVYEGEYAIDGGKLEVQFDASGKEVARETSKKDTKEHKEKDGNKDEHGKN